jgi:hypothetical protein
LITDVEQLILKALLHVCISANARVGTGLHLQRLTPASEQLLALQLARPTWVLIRLIIACSNSGWLAGYELGSSSAMSAQLQLIIDTHQVHDSDAIVESAVLGCTVCSTTAGSVHQLWQHPSG